MTAKECDLIYASLQHFIDNSSVLQSGESLGLCGVVRSGVVVEEWAYIHIARIFWMWEHTTYDLGEGIEVIIDHASFYGGVAKIYRTENDRLEKVLMCFESKDAVNMFINKAKLIIDSICSCNRYKRIKYNHWLSGYDEDRLAKGKEHKEVNASL